MWQRIQTVFLILAALAGAALFLENMDLARITSQADLTMSHPMIADGAFDVFDLPVLEVLAVLQVLLALLAIFLFKNRRLQMRVVGLAVLAVLIFGLAAAYYFFEEYDTVREQAGAVAGAGVVLPLVALVSLLLANRFIKRDDRIVRSADRLR